MADIPSNLDPMNNIEILFDASHSEQLMNKIGANINGLIDLAGNFELFNTGGTFEVPEGITNLFVYASGGGAGGGGNGATSGSPTGGNGGNGVIPSLGILRGVAFGETYTVIIGSGGAGGAGGGAGGPGGTGGTGGNTTFAGTAGTLTYYGAFGGVGGSSLIAPRFNRTQKQGGIHYSIGGEFDDVNAGAGDIGAPSIYASGGTFGGGFNGSGGGAGLAAGGNGGVGAAAGGSAAANSSAGGGGGGADGTIQAGGTGGSGVLILTW